MILPCRTLQSRAAKPLAFKEEIFKQDIDLQTPTVLSSRLRILDKLPNNSTDYRISARLTLGFANDNEAAQRQSLQIFRQADEELGRLDA